MIEEINLDLNRCEKVLSENNYLEIIIAIEELQDKYRSKIKSLNEASNDVVWNYNKKDLENIKNSLIKYKEEVILKEKLNNISQKISELKSYVEKNPHIKNQDNLTTIIELIENTNEKDISLDEKYEELKVCLNLVSDFNREISIYILELITLVIR